MFVCRAPTYTAHFFVTPLRQSAASLSVLCFVVRGSVFKVSIPQLFNMLRNIECVLQCRSSVHRYFCYNKINFQSNRNKWKRVIEVNTGKFISAQFLFTLLIPACRWCLSNLRSDNEFASAVIVSCCVPAEMIIRGYFIICLSVCQWVQMVWLYCTVTWASSLQHSSSLQEFNEAFYKTTISQQHNHRSTNATDRFVSAGVYTVF